jgi:hypothetical protein
MNIGDKVKVKDLQWYENSPKNTLNEVKTSDLGFFLPKMTKYCGQLVTIVDQYGHFYLIEEDNQSFFWTPEMFEL